MEFLTPYVRQIETALQQFELPAHPNNLYDPLQYFLQLGGKRTRPVLALLACELFDNKYQKAIPSAMCVELFHNFTLIHDDIMDEAPLRRGMSTVHEKWNTNIAILSGDVLFVEAYKQLMQYEPAVLKELMEVFSQTAIEVCEGQQMDMDFESSDSVTIPSYIEMIRLKTSVLLGAALKMGAIVGGASSADANHLYQFGENIGIAFQLQDDYLDLYADPDKFGKQVGGDILSNKKTFLWLTALSRCNGEQLALFEAMKNTSDKQNKISLAKTLFNQLDVPNLIQKEMEKFYLKAMDALEKVDVPPAKKEVLQGLAKYLIIREK
jgi:geranylgeranyl diphosphate synthase type II